MARSEELETLTRKLLGDWLEYIPSGDAYQTALVCDDEKRRFLLVGTGFENGRYVHETLFDVQIREGKVWIYANNVDRGLDEELIAQGVALTEIVVDWHPQRTLV